MRRHYSEERISVICAGLIDAVTLPETICTFDFRYATLDPGGGRAQLSQRHEGHGHMVSSRSGGYAEDQPP
ncbi:MAG: hypothetical protein ABSH13_12460 [Candidatus Acidiferrum sp.]